MALQKNYDAVHNARQADCRALVAPHVKLRTHGKTRIGLCPFHAEKTPSFYVYENGYHCFGCGASGDSIQWLVAAEGYTFQDAVKVLSGEAVDSRPPVLTVEPKAIASPFDEEAIDSAQRAVTVWESAQPINGTVAESFLRKRGARVLSPELRFMPSLWSGQARMALPCMISAIRQGSTPRAIQRTWIDPDTLERVGDRMTLGSIGRGAVRLFPAGSILGLAEGVEKALAAKRIFSIPTWSACGTRMDRVQIPETVKRLVIFADSDDPGRAAAEAAEQAHGKSGLPVEVVFPIAPYKDFDEWLMRQ